MKNILFTLFLLFTFSMSAQQMAFTTVDFKAKDNSQNNLAELFDKFYGDAKFNSGSILLERLWQGAAKGMSHRMVWIWELDNGGRADEMKEYENEAFWAQMRSHIEEWGEAKSGRILSWHEGDVVEFPYGHIWDIKPADPVAFKKAHDKFVKKAGKMFENKVVGFGTYDVNMPNGATHWVVIGEKGTNGHLSMYNTIEKDYAKEMQEALNSRGEVEFVQDFMIEVLKRYQ